MIPFFSKSVEYVTAHFFSLVSIWVIAMSNRAQLLHNLRLAEKRRQKKSAVVPIASLRQANAVDSFKECERVAKLLVEIARQHSQLTDRQVVRAIDSLIHQRTAADPLTRELQTKLSLLGAEGGIDRQRMFTELKRVATTIRRDFSHVTPQAYLEYLQILSN